MWTQKRHIEDVPVRAYWERSDGAYVWYDTSSPYPNPIDPNCRMWVAFGPDDRYLAKNTRRVKWMKIPRRWKTPEAAMRALDREIPLG